MTLDVLTLQRPPSEAVSIDISPKGATGMAEVGVESKLSRLFENLRQLSIYLAPFKYL